MLINILKRIYHFILLLTFLSILQSCKKDMVVDVNFESNQSKFFTIPVDSDPVVGRIIENLRIQNDKSSFVNDFTKAHGIPIWAKAKIKIIKNLLKAGSVNLLNESPTDTIVTIPVVIETTNIILPNIETKKSGR